jgi:hypothetical protein
VEKVDGRVVEPCSKISQHDSEPLSGLSYIEMSSTRKKVTK